MPGTITKRVLFTHTCQLYRMGGLRLIVAVMTARRGVPFLTVLMTVGEKTW